MADYTGIADTGNRILDLLRETLVPELLNSADQIGLCSPEDHGDYAVGVWLYDVKEDTDIQMHDMVSLNRQSQRYPSVYLVLRYMITLYLQSDLKYRAVQEHQMIGKIIQTLRDHAVLGDLQQSFAGGPSEMDVRIQMQELSVEEKMRIWTFPNMPYKTSLFYSAGPVEVQSSRKKTVSRVREIQYQFTD
ncbi:MAG: DUF4255 domain-containing protein [Hespellia sp.]|jgi:hypothetical protein|nr:DUF4255 domain-containing protein [Hespellia sp.]